MTAAAGRAVDSVEKVVDEYINSEITDVECLR